MGARYRHGPCADRRVRRQAVRNGRLGARQEQRDQSRHARFYDMEPERAGNWTSKAFNPEDKQTYQGVLTLTSPTTMTTSGCMIGKLLCRSMYWRRAGG